MTAARRGAGVPVQERAERLKEEIYLTFTMLAVVITMDSHGEVSPGEAILTLVFTVGATLLAIFAADVIAHLAVRGRVHTPEELRHAFAVSIGAAGAAAAPFGFLILAAIGLLTVDTALTAGMFALLAALVVVGWVAVRRVRLRWWQRILALGAHACLGLAVIGLELLAHG